MNRIERLKAAIEGECDGLAITDAHARAILTYVDEGEASHHAALQRIGSALDLLPGTDLHTQAVPAILALRADARDAARYRHMRESAAAKWRNGPGLYWYLPALTPMTAEGLDASIDAAIAAKERG